MYVNFEFAALLPSPYSRVKKCAKFKTNIQLVSVDSFLYHLSSSITFHFILYVLGYYTVQSCCNRNANKVIIKHSQKKSQYKSISTKKVIWWENTLFKIGGK